MRTSQEAPELDGADALAKAMDQSPELTAKYRQLRDEGKLVQETVSAPESALELRKSKGSGHDELLRCPGRGPQAEAGSLRVGGVE
jgi:hypothetical protein